MFRPVYLLGDIHGRLEAICNKLKFANATDMIIVQVGDFGISIDASLTQSAQQFKQKLQEYNKFFKLRNITFYAIRGNHDDPANFDGRYDMSNLKLLPDYTVLELNEQRWLFVGGALSIDRLLRKARMEKDGGVDWFEDEQFVLDKQKVYDAGKIDVVVTHTAPDGVCGYDLVGRSGFVNDMFEKGDVSIYTDIKREQMLLHDMYDLLNFQGGELYNWYHGHFHKAVSNTFWHTKFRCLAIDEMLEHRI